MSTGLESGERSRPDLDGRLFPLEVLGELASHKDRRETANNGVNFSRVEWQIDITGGRYRKVPNTHEDNWVWSPQGVVNMHRPETWGYVQFSTAPFGQAVFHPDVDGPVKRRLHEIYYAQIAFQKKNHRWAANLEELGTLLAPSAGMATPRLEANQFGFTAALPSLDKSLSRTWQIRQDALLWKLPEEKDKEDDKP